MRKRLRNSLDDFVKKLRYIGNTSLVLEKISDLSKTEQKKAGV